MAKVEGKVARRYAKALFELCAPTELDSVRDGLKDLAAAWSSNAPLRAALLNPSVPMANRIAVIGELSKKARAGDTRFANFISVLLENGRLNALPEILVSFSSMIDSLKKLLALEVTSAFEVPTGERDEFLNGIRSKFGAMASISWKVDPAILGGLVVKAGDKQLDSSIRGSLEKFRAELVR